MGVKLKLSLGIASLILGISLLGGTFAYFTDEEESVNEIKAGTLDLKPETPSMVLFTINNMAPGENQENDLVLSNGGSINISEIILNTSFTSKDSNNVDVGSLQDDLLVTITDITNSSSPITIINAAPLKDISQAQYSNKNLGTLAVGSGTKKIKIRLDYRNSTPSTQNDQQGDSVTITFSFEARQ
jgi:spore coat-associated protein N